MQYVYYHTCPFCLHNYKVRRRKDGKIILRKHKHTVGDVRAVGNGLFVTKEKRELCPGSELVVDE